MKFWNGTAHQTVTNMSYQRITTSMNTPSITMTNPADSQNNHSACAGKKGLGDAAPQQAKCKRCYLCPACYYAPGLGFGRPWNRSPEKKEISFRENFWAEKPSKTVNSEKQTDAKCQQSLTPQRFPKFSKRENDFEGYVIW